jgi:hypothetical protein
MGRVKTEFPLLDPALIKEVMPQRLKPLRSVS